MQVSVVTQKPREEMLQGKGNNVLFKRPKVVK